MRRSVVSVMIGAIVFMAVEPSYAARKLSSKESESISKACAEKTIELLRSPTIDKYYNFTKRPNFGDYRHQISQCINYKPKPYENKDEVYKACREPVDKQVKEILNNILLNDAYNEAGCMDARPDEFGGLAGQPKIVPIESDCTLKSRMKVLTSYKYVGTDPNGSSEVYYQLNYSQPVRGKGGKMVTSEIVAYSPSHVGECIDITLIKVVK